jgi:hypothetical protein
MTPSDSPLRSALVSGIAYAIARAPLADKNDSALDVAARLAPLVIESGYLAALAADPAPKPPPGTRLVVASENLLDDFGTRDNEGRALTFEWGEPDEHGWYTPTFTSHEDSAFIARLVARAAPSSEGETVEALDVERLTRALFDTERPGDWPTWDDYVAAFGSPGIPPWRRKAEKLAREYAALRPASPRAEPDHE